MCKICQYNMVNNIDRLLLAGHTPASVSRRYPGFTPAELQRHAEHLHHKMALASRRFQASLHQGLFIKLHLVMEMVLTVIRGAKGGGDAKLVLQASREFSRIVALMTKMAAKIDFDPEFLYCLMANPQWDLQEDSLLPSAFQALAESRRTLKQQVFFTPCPDPDQEPIPDQTPAPTSGDPKSALETPHLRLADPIPGQHQPITGSQKPETIRDPSGTAAGQNRDQSRNEAGQKREMSGKRTLMDRISD